MNCDFDKICIKKFHDIGMITLNDPDNYNVFFMNTFNEIERALDLFEIDNDVKIILLNAKNRVSNKGIKIFSAGVNLKEYDIKFKLLKDNPAEFEKMLKKSRSLLFRIEKINKPVIAGVNGFAIGGAFELVLACDAILASDSAQFQLSEVNLGLIPGYGGIHRLLRLTGKNRTFDIVANARILSAQEAFNLGIVTKTCSDTDFDHDVMEYCKNLAQKSEQALMLIKNTINHLVSDITTNTEIEIKNFLKAVSSSEVEEKMLMSQSKNSFIHK